MAQPKYAEPMEVDAVPVVTRVGMTADEYFALPETMQPQNLIEGRLYVSPSPIDRHQDIVGELYIELSGYRREHGGYVILSPFDCWLADWTVVQPDTGYVIAARRQLVDRYMHGAPDLVVEVLSPGTRRFDRQKKLQTYGVNGVREAWLVDPDAETVTVFTGNGSEWTRERSVLFGEAIPSDIVDIGAGNLVRDTAE
ncbi:MAG TPA: Uma2 family endonuclease [Tepidiformaceae bacterium]|nr:Uma2 family endonuclease [Tepidiformaceae bacterium]